MRVQKYTLFFENNTLCEKYELRRGKKRCPIMKKEYPLAHAKLHVQGD